MISSKVSRNSSAVFFAFSVSSSTRICNAKCSTSWKSTRFFRRFAAANSSANCFVRRTTSSNIGSVRSNCSIIISGEQKKYCLQIFFTTSFACSLRLFTSSNLSGSPSKPLLLASLSYLISESAPYSSQKEVSFDKLSYFSRSLCTAFSYISGPSSCCVIASACFKSCSQSFKTKQIFSVSGASHSARSNSSLFSMR